MECRSRRAVRIESVIEVTHENDGRPSRRLGQHGGRTARSESRLAALTAEGGSDVAALAALQQYDANQKETNNDVNNSIRIIMLSLWCGRGDLNPHALRRHPLKMVCLPIPPLPQYFLLNQLLVEAGRGSEQHRMANLNFPQGAIQRRT